MMYFSGHSRSCKSQSTRNCGMRKAFATELVSSGRGGAIARHHHPREPAGATLAGLARSRFAPVGRDGEGNLLSVPALRRDGTRISVEFSILPFRGADGKISGMAAVMRDVTKRFEELKALRRADGQSSKPRRAELMPIPRSRSGKYPWSHQSN